MIHRFDRLDSTQDTAHQLAAAGAPAGSVVIAAVQTRGRGTRGRPWSSDHGGLWLSAILRPAASQAEGLSLRIGLELAEALSERRPGERVELKWPNDLVARGRKLGGILVEARWEGSTPAWAIVGVGLNVSNPIPEELADRTIRWTELDPTATPPLIEPIVLASIERVAQREGGPLSAAELRRFADRDWLRGRRVAGPISGIAAGVAPDGRLLVTTPDGALRMVADPVLVPDLAAPPDRA
jgi:BirA family biotin operon repressor/biotin-[acetyl-CoA-carboxylase] ligase